MAELLVRTRSVVDVDPDRLDEWLDASFKDEYVEVVDRESGRLITTAGEDLPPFTCPECGEPSYGILTCGGEKKHQHQDGEWCTVQTKQ